MSDQRDTWTQGIESILEEIRLNSMTISEYHKDRYYHQKGHLKYFRIPTIIFSAMNSVFSVGLQPYCAQQLISVLCCLISMVCGIISSIELFLSIQTTMENELIASKEFYLLSVDIFKMLYLERETRMINGKTYLDETYQTYCKLIENTNLVKKNMKNMITLPTVQKVLKDQNHNLILNDLSDRIINPVTNKIKSKTMKEITNLYNEETDIEKNLDNSFTAVPDLIQNNAIELISNETDVLPIPNSISINMTEFSDTDLNQVNEQNAHNISDNIIDSEINKTKRKYTKKADKILK
jgi:hypothetical protein